MPSRSFRSSSFLRWSGRTTSSASSQNRYVPRPWENEKFLAAAKSSRHGKSKTLAPRSLAAAFVPSVDPVSVTRISSGNPATLSRHRPNTSSSFFTIMQRLTETTATPRFHTVLLPVYVPCENS